MLRKANTKLLELKKIHDAYSIFGTTLACPHLHWVCLCKREREGEGIWQKEKGREKLRKTEIEI